MNKFYTLEIFQRSNENKEKNELTEINNKIKYKGINIKNNTLLKNREKLQNSNKYLTKLIFLPKLSNKI